MILHGYGCSWTEGVGSDYDYEESLTDRDDKRLFRNKHSWVKKLSDRLNLNHINHGISGNANNKIFNTVVEDVQTGRIKSDDLVVIMWSSSLRDYVPFLPKGEWVSWSVKHLMEKTNRVCIIGEAEGRIGISETFARWVGLKNSKGTYFW